MIDGLTKPQVAAVVDTFVRANEISDFEWSLQLVEAGCSDHGGATASTNGVGPGQHYNP